MVFLGTDMAKLNVYVDDPLLFAAGSQLRRGGLISPYSVLLNTHGVVEPVPRDVESGVDIPLPARRVVQHSELTFEYADGQR